MKLARFAQALLVATMAFASSSASATTNLFTNLSELEPNPIPPVAQERQGDVSAELLDESKTLTKNGQPSTLTLNLFDDVVLTTDIKQVEEHSATQYELSGNITGQETSAVVLSVDGDFIMGEVIDEDGNFYSLEPLGQKRVRIANLVLNLIFDVDMPEETCEDRQQHQAPIGDIGVTEETEEATETHTLDFVVLCSEAVSNASGDRLEQTLNRAIAAANLALDSSNTMTQIRMVHFETTDYDEEQGSVQYLDDLIDCGKIEPRAVDSEPDPLDPADQTWLAARAHLAREQYDADFVVFFVEDYSGYYGMSAEIGADGASAYVIVRRSPFTGWIIAHELAHLLGAAHVNERGLFFYSSGNLIGLTRQTIMKGDEGWGVPIPRFSNPGQNAFPGIPLGVEECSDNARTLRKTVSTAANWRVTPNTTVEIKNAAGEVLARWYRSGLLVLRGEVFMEASEEQLSSHGFFDLIIQTPDHVLARLDSDTGNLYIRGAMRFPNEGEGETLPFRIMDSSGKFAAGFTLTGSLVLNERVVIQNYTNF